MGVPRHRVHRGSLWTGVVLLTLTYGAHGFHPQETAISPAESQDTLLTMFRDLYEAELMRQMASRQLQPPEPESAQPRSALYEPMPIPLAFHDSRYGGEGSREEKRASSYMALCHFKICSVGRKRSNARAFARFRK